MGLIHPLGLLWGGGTSKMRHLVGSLRLVRVCPQRELWDSCFLASVEGNNGSTTCFWWYSHRTNATGCNSHKPKPLNCELKWLLSPTELTSHLFSHRDGKLAHSPWLWNLVFGEEGTASLGTLLQLAAEASSRVLAASCCAASHGQHHSWESQTDILDVYEQLLWKAGCSFWLYHMKSIVSHRFKTEGLVRSILCTISWALILHNLKSIYLTIKIRRRLCQLVCHFCKPHVPFEVNSQSQTGHFSPAVPCGSDRQLKGIIKQCHQRWHKLCCL